MALLAALSRQAVKKINNAKRYAARLSYGETVPFIYRGLTGTAIKKQRAFNCRSCFVFLPISALLFTTGFGFSANRDATRGKRARVRSHPKENLIQPKPCPRPNLRERRGVLPPSAWQFRACSYTVNYRRPPRSRDPQK